MHLPRGCACPGYSTDKSDKAAALKFKITCQADGTYSKVPNLGKCVDIDDCVGHICCLSCQGLHALPGQSTLLVYQWATPGGSG